MKITAYYMEVKENGVVYSGKKIKIDNREEAVLALLGGEIKAHVLHSDIVLWERKDAMRKEPLNRVYMENGNILKVFFGSLLLMKRKNHTLASITDKEIKQAQEYIRPAFVLQGGIVLPDKNHYSLKNSLKSQ